MLYYLNNYLSCNTVTYFNTSILLVNYSYCDFKMMYLKEPLNIYCIVIQQYYFI